MESSARSGEAVDRDTVPVKARAGIDVRAVDEQLGRRAGELLGAARRRDGIHATLVLLAHDRDHIVTSDPGDLEPLARASGRHEEIVRA